MKFPMIPPKPTPSTVLSNLNYRNSTFLGVHAEILRSFLTTLFLTPYSTCWYKSIDSIRTSPNANTSSQLQCYHPGPRHMALRYHCNNFLTCLSTSRITRAFTQQPEWSLRKANSSMAFLYAKPPINPHHTQWKLKPTFWPTNPSDLTLLWLISFYDYPPSGPLSSSSLISCYSLNRTPQARIALAIFSCLNVLCQNIPVSSPLPLALYSKVVIYFLPALTLYFMFPLSVLFIP